MKKAFCFDLDGTLTKVEVASLLGKELGIHEELQVLTMATMQGLIPFEASLKLRVKLLSTIPITRIRAILSEVPFFEEIRGFLSRNKENCFIITGSLDVHVKDIIDKVGCKSMASIAEVENDYVKGISHVLDKGEAINRIKNMGYEKIISVGDGSNDIPMFEQSHVSIAYFGTNPFNKKLSEVSSCVVFDEGALCKILKML